MINQFKYGFTRFFQNIVDATQGVTAWEAPTFGITNLPAARRGLSFPARSLHRRAGFQCVDRVDAERQCGLYQLTTPNNLPS